MVSVNGITSQPHFTANGAIDAQKNKENEKVSKPVLTSAQTKAAIGLGLAALAAAGVYIATRGKGKLKAKPKANSVNPEIKPPEVKQPDAPKLEPMKMNDDARIRYNRTRELCNGSTNVRVHDEKSPVLQKMAKYYAQEEKLSSLPKMLETFKKEIQTKSAKDLWDMKTSLWKDEGKFTALIRTRSKANPRKSYEMFGYSKRPSCEELAPYYLDKTEMAQYKFIKNKEDLIDNAVKAKHEDILHNHLFKKGDKEVDVKSIREYITNDDQLRAFSQYYDAYPLNGVLRKGAKLDEVDKATINAMDKVFEAAPALKKDAVVYRAVHGHPVFKDQNNFINSLKEGMVITDKSYVSTSIDVDNAQFKQFAHQTIDDGFGALMRIKLPKGTKGVLGGYSEFLLPRNNKIKINKIEMVDGVKVMDCEYVL